MEDGEGAEESTGRKVGDDDEKDGGEEEETEEPSALRMIGAAGSGPVASKTSCQPFSVRCKQVRQMRQSGVYWMLERTRIKWNGRASKNS